MGSASLKQTSENSPVSPAFQTNVSCAFSSELETERGRMKMLIAAATFGEAFPAVEMASVRHEGGRA